MGKAQVGIFLLAIGPLAYGGYCCGIAASYYLGDRGDVGSAFISVMTVPIGIVLGLIASWFIAVKLV